MLFFHTRINKKNINRRHCEEHAFTGGDEANLYGVIKLNMSSNFTFSARTNWELSGNRLNDELDRLRLEGIPIIDLTESNPTRCGFQYPDEILKALSDTKNLSYLPESKGMLHARQAISKYYLDSGFDVDPESIVLTSSTSEGYTFLFRLLVNPGEKVLIARPSYPLFQYLIELADATYDFYPLIFDGKRWKIDLAVLEEAIDPLTRVIILVNPNNPTGSYITSEELEEINRLCVRHKLALISDEVFFDYRLNPSDREGVSLVNNSATATYVLNGLSKNLALPQMKLSWIVTSGPKPDVDESLKRLEMIADTFLSVNTPVQNALGLWLTARKEIQTEVLDRLRRNHGMIKDFASQHGLSFFVSRGGWYAVLKFPSVIDEEKWILELLTRKHVLVHPGYFFDFDGDGFIVLSLLPAIERMTEGLSAISDVIRRKV